MEIRKEGSRGGRVEARGHMRGDLITVKTERDNAYADQVDAGHKVERRAQAIWVMGIVLAVIFALALVLPRSVFAPGLYEHGLSDWAMELQAQVHGLFSSAVGQGTAQLAIRLAIVALAGAGLGMTGAVYQGSLKNALASPSTLGIMSGASLGSCVFVLLFVTDDPATTAYLNGIGDAAAADSLPLPQYVFSMWGQSFFSLVGCGVVAALLLCVVKLAGKRKVSNIMLIIIGQIIGSVAGTLVGLARYYYLITDPYGTKAAAFETLQAASFYRNFGVVDLLCIAIPLIVVLALIVRMAPKLTLLAFSDDEARAMGVETKRWRVLMVVACTLLTAIIVSFCGMVGFVGFLVPHLTRKFVGPDFKYLIPASAVMGAAFVLGCYTVIEVVNADYSESVGMVISIVGAVVFLVMALRQREATRGDFI